MRSIAAVMIFLLAACSGLKKLERRAKSGDVHACDALVNSMEERIQFKESIFYTNRDKKTEAKIRKYSSLCIRLDSGNFYKGHHFLNLAKSDSSISDKYYHYYKAAQFGDGDAQYITGISYFDGKQKKVNKDSALYWYEMSAMSLSRYAPFASKAAADMLYKGTDVKGDTIMALYYYKRACAFFGNNSELSACDSVISYYRRKKIKDSSEIMIYEDFAQPLRERSKRFNAK